MDDIPSKDESPRFLKVLKALKQASHQLQSAPTIADSDDSNSSAIKTLLDLETHSDSFFSDDPKLAALSQYLSDLRNLVDTLQKARGYSLRSILTRRVSAHSISRVAGSIESEIQAWIDRENVEALANLLRDQPVDDLRGEEFDNEDEDEVVMLLTQFIDRVSQGFNRDLQDLILKSKVISLFESILLDSKQSFRIREKAAFCVATLIRFNKDVFVGKVKMGSTIRALVAMSTTSSMSVLCSLIRSIKSPFVDEIVSNGEIPKIIGFLSVKETEKRVIALDCILDIGYLGRKGAIEAILEEGLIEKLVEMQRSELGGDLMDIVSSHEDNAEENEMKKMSGTREKTEKFLETRPFASCVARFAVQMEVGEGLRQSEKRAMKQEILKRIREVEVSVCDVAEIATIFAEVLWGSSP